MSKKLTQQQQDVVHAAFDQMIQEVSDNANLNVDEALTALDILRARLSTLRGIDVMPEVE